MARATQEAAIVSGRGVLRPIAALVLAGMLLSGCQSIIEQTYEPTISPSSNPQIVEEVQKNDPRAQMGAREHPASSRAMAANTRTPRPSGSSRALPAR
jgi:hypothetical protein